MGKLAGAGGVHAPVVVGHDFLEGARPQVRDAVPGGAEGCDDELRVLCRMHRRARASRGSRAATVGRERSRSVGHAPFCLLLAQTP